MIESFLPGGAERLGLGYASSRPRGRKLVYTSIAGYSPEGVDAHRPGFDFAIQAEAGGMSITGEADGPPLKVGVAIADITTGMFATIGTLAALREPTSAVAGTTCRSASTTRSWPGSRTAARTGWSGARSRTGSATRTRRSCPTRPSRPATDT